LKVLHINSNYLYTTLHEEMIQNLNLKGIENTVFMPTSGKIKYVVEPKGYVYNPTCFSDKDRYFFHGKQIKILNSLKESLDIASYDILHAHTLFTDGGIAYKLKKETHRPYVVAVRNTDVNTFFKYMAHLRGYGVRILKEAEKVIFISENYRSLVLDKYIPAKMEKEIFNKSEVIPNGIDNYWFENRGYPKTLKNSGKDINLIYAGTINKNKNIITTSKAVETLCKKGYNIKFTVVGKVADKSIYQKIKNKPYINYLEQKSKEELIDIYRANDIFVMPSITETFGLVYAEAMSQGLPVIYSKGQGFDGQFEEGKVGYHVNSRNAKEISKRVMEIVGNYEKISSNSLNLYKKYNWIDIAEQYKKLYTSIQ
jgi:glycosyltransferase involved in cell wall biosynthesis